MRASLGCRRANSGESISEPVVPAGTLEAEGTGVGSEVSTAVVFPVGPRMTGFLWGTGSSAQPGEDETEGQGGADARTHGTHAVFPSRVVALTLALWLPMGPKPSMPLGAMAAWPRSRGRGVAPTLRSAAPAKAPAGGRYRESRLLEMVATVGDGGHPPPQDQACSKRFQIPFLECGG